MEEAIWSLASRTIKLHKIALNSQEKCPTVLLLTQGSFRTQNPCPDEVWQLLAACSHKLHQERTGLMSHEPHAVP